MTILLSVVITGAGYNLPPDSLCQCHSDGRARQHAYSEIDPRDLVSVGVYLFGPWLDQPPHLNGDPSTILRSLIRHRLWQPEAAIYHNC